MQERSGSIFRSGRSFAGHLSLAVAVEITHGQLRVVRTGANVRAQIDAPQVLARQRIAVEEYVRGDAGLRVVLRVGRIPLEHEVVDTVAVEVAGGGIVGAVGCS